MALELPTSSFQLHVGHVSLDVQPATLVSELKSRYRATALGPKFPADLFPIQLFIKGFKAELPDGNSVLQCGLEPGQRLLVKLPLEGTVLMDEGPEEDEDEEVSEQVAVRRL